MPEFFSYYAPHKLNALVVYQQQKENCWWWIDNDILV
jgi:hypothetical protein